MKLRRLTVCLTACALAAVGTGSVVAATSASRVRVVASPARGLVRHFAILRRGRIASVRIPVQVQHLALPGRLTADRGLNAAAAQPVTLADGEQGWFVPGSSGACLEWGSSAACDSTADTLRGGLVGVVVVGSTETIVGAVPDGVTVAVTKADGATVSLPVTDNTYSASTSTGNLFSSLHVRLSSGAESTLGMPDLHPTLR